MSLSYAEESVLLWTHTGRYHCPECSEDRKKRNPTLTVTVESDHSLYNCHHCGWSGRVNRVDPLAKYHTAKIKAATVTPIPTELNENQDMVAKFFQRRGITVPDLAELKGVEVRTTEKYFAQLKEKLPAIGFVYGNPKEPEAIKWRPADGRKAFTQDGAAASFYGIDALSPDTKEIIIVEGESDVVALASVGIQAISVPNGAPMKVSANKRLTPEQDVKYGYVWEARDLINGADKIILAVDNDPAGDALAEELARRVGRAKCWRTMYPEGAKDPTDILTGVGATKDRVDRTAIMLNLLSASEPLPLQGVYSAASYMGDVHQLYKEGMGSGTSTGMKVVDDLFTIKPGMVYVMTGYPGSGKSEFVDQLMVNLSLKESWKWAVASFENPPPLHIVKLSEKIIGKPFFEGVTPRMSKDQVAEAAEFIDDHFVFLESKDGLTTVPSIMERTQQAVMRLGVQGLVIDPYNYLALGDTANEHQGITKMLSELGAFARATGIAIFFVAHPAKVHADSDGFMPVPKGHHISGSAAWFAKADVGVTVHRGEVGVEIHCWKCRFKWLGSVGETVLGYELPTGRYFERSPAEQDALVPAGNKFPTGKAKTSGATKPRHRNWQDTDDNWGKDVWGQK